MAPKPFNESMFAATKFTSAAAKAKFGNDLARFVAGGFRRTMFTKTLYRNLSDCFGHIAEFDVHGFYDVWFSTTQRQLDWVSHTLSASAVGDPAWTFSDVEGAFQNWLSEQYATV